MSETNETRTKTAGQIAFEAYNASKGGLTYDGKPIPPWSEVPDASGVKQAWEAAAIEIENALLVSLDHQPGTLIDRARNAVNAFVPKSREQSLTLTKLDEAAMWLAAAREAS